MFLFKSSVQLKLRVLLNLSSGKTSFSVLTGKFCLHIKMFFFFNNGEVWDGAGGEEIQSFELQY
jgi:hypothetical protein